MRIASEIFFAPVLTILKAEPLGRGLLEDRLPAFLSAALCCSGFKG